MTDTTVTPVQMPQRYDIQVNEDGRLDYDAVENGDWVDADDVQPLVAEINRQRARVEVLERELSGIAEFCDAIARRNSESGREPYVTIANSARVALRT